MYVYNIKYLFTKKHFNPPFIGDYHSHEFIVNFELQGNISSDLIKEQYGIDTVEFQKHLGRFLLSINDNLNEDPMLYDTSGSTEAMCEMFLKHFPSYLKDQGYKKIKNIYCNSISVFEGQFRETKLIVNDYIFAI